MYVHNSSKLIYLASPRTGSTATASALMDAGFEKKGKHHEAFEMGPAWTTFTAVRNHWDAAASWVLAHNLPMFIDSLEFVLKNEYITENEMWAYHKTDLLIRYEQLQEQLDNVLKVFDIEPVKLPEENVSANREGKHYRELYNRKTKNYIYNRFKDEILRLGYEF